MGKNKVKTGPQNVMIRNHEESWDNSVIDEVGDLESGSSESRGPSPTTKVLTAPKNECGKSEKNRRVLRLRWKRYVWRGSPRPIGKNKKSMREEEIAILDH